MAINWLVRFKNKAFWLALVPAVLLVAQLVASWFGYQWDFVYIGEEATKFINAIFMVLTLLGVVGDFTTPGMDDSARALAYVEPGVIGKHVKED